MSMLSQVSRTTVSMLGTVNTTANSLSNAVNTVASTLDMANAFIQKAKEKQMIDDKFEMEHYIDIAEANALSNAARIQHDLNKELNNNPELKAVYEKLTPEFKKIRDSLQNDLEKMRANRISE